MRDNTNAQSENRKGRRKLNRKIMSNSQRAEGRANRESGVTDRKGRRER
jgi:hypothetical protein